jgi:hypothetical protein
VIFSAGEVEGSDYGEKERDEKGEKGLQLFFPAN